MINLLEVEVDYGDYTQVHRFKSRSGMDNFIELVGKNYTYKILKGPV